MFSKNWTILIILLAGLCKSETIPRIQTANVLAEQSVQIILNRNGDTARIYVPSGSIVMAPAYFDRLSESIAIKDKLLSNAILERYTKNDHFYFQNKLYIDTHYGVMSGAEIMVGGRSEFVL